MQKNFFSRSQLPEKALALGLGLGLVATQFLAISQPVRAAALAAPTCNGLTATIYVEDDEIIGGSQDGDNYSGTLSGTSGNDIIVGTSENDTISGNDGNDTICGRAGNDALNGNDGQDWLNGQDGNDILTGGANTDTLLGGNGDDRLSGAGDTMNGGEGNDFCDQDTGTAGQNCEAGSDEGMIVIKENSVPNDAQNFSFTSTNGLGIFSLDDDNDSTLSNKITFPNLDAGTYTVTQGALPAGWDMTNIQCSTGGAVNLPDQKATITLTEGNIVTCTFTNTDEDVSQCNDGIDNDNDGLIDLNDSGCENSQDNEESGATTATQCNDDTDNDRDGLKDENDPGCLTDKSDSDTYNPLDNSETNRTGSGTKTCEVSIDLSSEFWVKLKENNPEAYAKALVRIEARKAKLAHLCEKHPAIYRKIISRQAAVISKNIEKWEKRDERKLENENDDDESETRKEKWKEGKEKKNGKKGK